MTATRLLRLAILPVVYLALASCAQLPSAEDRIVQLLAADAPYHVISPQLFAQLGWDLPDGGAAVTQLAKEAPGGAFDPRTLASIPAEKLGYTARWHETRFRVYGLDWDIGALHLLPKNAVAGLPTMIIINGGAANWYEFFIGPKNAAGLAQYLAQRIPVVLVTIPGNYRHGGWTETDFGERIPGYLLDRDVAADEAKIRNTIYTFRVVTDGIKAVIDEIVTGPAVIIGIRPAARRSSSSKSHSRARISGCRWAGERAARPACTRCGIFAVFVQSMTTRISASCARARPTSTRADISDR